MVIDFKMSYHCSQERTDRLAFIMLHGGLGEIFCEYQESDALLYRLTTTGVLMIIDPARKVLVTAYYINMEKAAAIIHRCKHTNYSHHSLYKVIEANEKMIKRNKNYA